ncbi:MAG TPA: cation transporter [Levilinea sp.]|nr:cation transporter [Levilinea sp.]
MKKKILLTVEGMYCSNCCMKLEGIEDHLAGVERAEASYHKGTMTVVYDEAKVSEAAIRAEVKRLGYEVTAAQALQI